MDSQYHNSKNDEHERREKILFKLQIQKFIHFFNQACFQLEVFQYKRKYILGLQIQIVKQCSLQGG